MILTKIGLVLTSLIFLWAIFQDIHISYRWHKRDRGNFWSLVEWEFDCLVLAVALILTGIAIWL